jgi:hypothetical protein
MFIFCEECGKKLIFRNNDGTFVFRFGKSHTEQPIVDMEISGEIKLTCLRRTCNHVTVLKLSDEGSSPSL